MNMHSNMLLIILNQQYNQFIKSVYVVVNILWGHKVSQKVFHKLNLAVAAGEVFSSLTHSCRRLLCFLTNSAFMRRGLQRHVDWSDRHEWKKGAELTLIEGYEGGVSLPWTRLNSLISPPCTQATAGIDPNFPLSLPNRDKSHITSRVSTAAVSLVHSTLYCLLSLTSFVESLQSLHFS